ncbi:hypothetical protein IV203_030034 [Nitzschia inconspicua]|uniref:DUF6824 domain-containing protein n=1 Tax=Nitzschia inconspicua TaxID=303405 RepID=A0A9K3Q1A4_9STRA|nr:hypothetical protein IV203_030034 [Nitzschia inconspicua]
MELPTILYGSQFSGNSSVISDDETEEMDGNTPLPARYKPSTSDCICARGKAYWDHPGNQKYRELIAAATPKYSETTNKLEKTLIVSEIVEAVHRAGGKFIKKVKKGGPFVIVSEVFAREKVGQSLRDGLSTKYKSATKFKKQRKPKSNSEKVHLDADKVVTSNRYVCQRIEELRYQVKCCGDLASDASIITLFSQTNSDILETIKRDHSMLQRYDESIASSSASQFCGI